MREHAYLHGPGFGFRADDFLEGANVDDGQLRIRGPDDRAHGRHQRRERCARPDRQILRDIEPGLTIRELAVRRVDLRYRLTLGPLTRISPTTPMMVLTLNAIANCCPRG